jgi:hypothetical protein
MEEEERRFRFTGVPEPQTFYAHGLSLAGVIDAKISRLPACSLATKMLMMREHETAKVRTKEKPKKISAIYQKISIAAEQTAGKSC